MDKQLTYREELEAKFTRHVNSRGGLFTRKTRNRLLGMSGLSGRDRTKKDFWHDVRETVAAGLVDLQLFLEFGGKENVDHVITVKTIRPIVESLLKYPSRLGQEPDIERAWIAQSFIENAFDYLRKMSTSSDITLSHKRTIDEAIDVSHFLVNSFKRMNGKSAMGNSKTEKAEEK